MGVGKLFSWHSLILIAALSPTLHAAPKLRLVTTTVGPVSIAVGANGAAQVVEAFNAGDGSLALQASSSVSWMSASVGAQRACTTRTGNCLPVNITLATSSLAKGVFTGRVTLSDSNALDAPQSITVTVQMGGSVPDSARLFVAPNGSTASVAFTTNSQIQGNPSTQGGGSWLSLALDAAGSFQFAMPYRIVARHLDGMAEGTYSGAVTVTGSNIPADNKTVPITLTVTSQPIAQPNPASISFRLPPGVVKQNQYVALSNSGLSNLNVTGATASVTTGGTWLTSTIVNGLVQITADVGTLSAGLYTGSVSVQSNAANPVSIPVQLEIIAATNPVSTAGLVYNTAALDNGLAPGSAAVLFGEQLSYVDPAVPTAVPLPTDLGGVKVFVNNVACPLYYTSFTQINFQIPYETPTGEVQVRVDRGSLRGNTITAQIAARAPRIIQFGINGVIVNQDGSLAIAGGSPARIGSAITIYAVGLGATSPAVATGAGAPGAEPLARVTPAPKAVFGGAFGSQTFVDPFFTGLTPGLVGLYQINVIIPDDAPTGEVGLQLVGDDYTSNRVIIPITR